ncbi:uncharacterized protein LOC119789387 [Cyprinodon tularosa]|uniref:uncharacterized protein LOC119789387 n=1 Tax=Cyprinodon tularosa TaxID=77115 RepID=UPI0018E2609E|nr:uncharacterized protein LOC119789387 [Cyprinodon tularosa]
MEMSHYCVPWRDSTGNSLLWLDERGTLLTGEGVGYYFRQTGCDSYLTVKLQSSSSRRYTCQFVEGNLVKIEAHYQLEGFRDWSPLSFIMLTLRITALILMVGITADIIRTRGRKKPQKDINGGGETAQRKTPASAMLEPPEKAGTNLRAPPAASHPEVNPAMGPRDPSPEDARPPGGEAARNKPLATRASTPKPRAPPVHQRAQSPPFPESPTGERGPTSHTTIPRGPGTDGRANKPAGHLGTPEAPAGPDSRAYTNPDHKQHSPQNPNPRRFLSQQNITKRYTCQFVEENTKVEANYTAVVKGINREVVHIYHRVGDDAVLPCKSPSPSSSSCSTVNWLYRRDEDMNPQQEVQRGIVVQSSSKAARLSVDNNCSLIINSITAEDAGGYRCQIEDGGSSDPDVYLNLMSISPVEAVPTENNITLICSLVRYISLGSCPKNSLLWVDETGANLTGEGVGYQFRQTGCDSYLTVKLQSSSSRRYTCQFVYGNTVKIEGHYQLEVFTAVPANNTIIIILFLRAGIFLLLLVVTAAVFIKCRKSRVTEERQTTGT